MGAGAETVIGSGVVAKGSLRSESDIVVDGTFTGDIKAAGSVVLGVNALVQGNVKARSVSISGELTGNVTAEEEASVHETGRLTGDIVAAQISISPGAIFNGTSKMNAPLAAREPEKSPSTSSGSIDD
jgi:cytoskeletal protein CcmA (bactofilin family)